MQVFESERDAGLGDLILSSKILLTSKINPLPPDRIPSKLIAEELFKASISDDQLFYMEDILISTVWNENDDIFDPVETYNAKATCENKPFNFGHDQTDIIGHILSHHLIDKDGHVLAADLNAESIPRFFHIVNNTVIYRMIGGRERADLIDQTIKDIRAGLWSVSMEVLAPHFDYGVVRPDGACSIVARNESTAWMSKYLRAYRTDDKAALALDPYLGSGVFVDPTTKEECRIGRLPRNFFFAGKGLVKNPGNIYSIVTKCSDEPIIAKSVYQNPDIVTPNSKESSSMPETNLELETANKRISELQAELDKVRTDKTTEVLAEKDSTIESLTTQLNAAKETVTTLTARSEKAEAELDAALNEMNTMKAEKVVASRKALLLDKGADPKSVDELVAKLAKLDDESFVATVNIMATAWVKPLEANRSKTETEIEEIKSAKEEVAPDLSVTDKPKTNETITNFLAQLFA